MCGFCERVKALFCKLQIPYAVIEMDVVQGGGALYERLKISS